MTAGRLARPCYVVIVLAAFAGALGGSPRRSSGAGRSRSRNARSDVRRRCARSPFRGSSRTPRSPTASASRGPNLPTRALALVVGAHWYPLRLGIVTFGVGGEDGQRRREPHADHGDPRRRPWTRRSTAGSRRSRRRCRFNFGKRDGWSYISGGIGWSTYTTEREDAPLPDPESRSKTINYGGGARWFAKKHLALSVDLRFYAVNPQDATATRPGFRA